MTDIVTSWTPTARIEYFDTLSQVSLTQSGVPQACLKFNENFATAGTGAGDTETLNITMNLPKDKFFTLNAIGVQAYAMDNTTERDAWDSSVQDIRFTLNTQPAARYFMLQNQGGVRVAASNYTVAWALTDGWVRDIVIDTRGADVSNDLLGEIYSGNASVGAVNFNIHAEFLMYDVTQGYNWPLFARVPVR